MLSTADFKRGLVFQLDNAPCLILDYTTQSPSARGGSTLVKTKYRNLLTGQVLEKAFKAGDKVDEADFEKRKGQFLYADGDNGIDQGCQNFKPPISKSLFLIRLALADNGCQVGDKGGKCIAQIMKCIGKKSQTS